MIVANIKALKEKKGSSRQAILKYVVANNKVDAAKAGVRVELALRKLAAAAAGEKGATNFKLPAEEPKAKKQAAKKAKKPAAKRDAKPKKTAKKPLPRRSPRSPQPRSPPRRLPQRKSKFLPSPLREAPPPKKNVYIWASPKRGGEGQNACPNYLWQFFSELADAGGGDSI